MRRIIPAAALLALALTGCDDAQEDGASVPATSPEASPTSTFSPPPPVTTTPTPEGAPGDAQVGSEAPAPDQPGPESVPTPSEQLDGP
ncbi:hypothetical protein ACT4S2_04255 [Kocuria turfanensis]|uniref:hypothetical protein n=1 Tax=Kocuria turfanensis TaxID=388357 RepID=UPI004036E9BF